MGNKIILMHHVVKVLAMHIQHRDHRSGLGEGKRQAASKTNQHGQIQCL